MGFLMNLFRLNSIVLENEQLKQKLSDNEKKYEESGFKAYADAEAALKDIKMQQEKACADGEAAIEEIKKRQENEQSILLYLKADTDSLMQQQEKTEAQIKANKRKIEKIRDAYHAATYAIEKYTKIPFDEFLVRNRYMIEESELLPTTELKIHSMDVKDLNKAFKDNNKRIDEVTKKYRARYTTKANKSIYELMVIALRAELQNILYDLKYQKLDIGIENVKKVTEKYLQLVCEGNQSIAPTATRFIGEIEYLFINAVKIEYNYYIRKEQARQEQLAIKEQMKQEAAERKALEAEMKKVENEETKYKTQIAEVQAKLEQSDDSEKDALLKRLTELEAQLASVALKKEEIANLQNGKAGNVYIISNLGSFGDSMFKIGMTRRLDPQDRIDELGSASVPFKFDVHSFIFSEDAVELENELHRRLNNKRVNKVNMRKEFFYSSLDELEALTYEICPTAEFRKTMIAEEYRQSLSTDKNFDEVLPSDDEDDDE